VADGQIDGVIIEVWAALGSNRAGGCSFYEWRVAMAAKPQKGDIICANRGLYRHYGIYAGNGSVIHDASKQGDFGQDIRVQKHR
jgi:cell wall-associated NlpC family hydrolase